MAATTFMLLAQEISSAKRAATTEDDGRWWRRLGLQSARNEVQVNERRRKIVKNTFAPVLMAEAAAKNTPSDGGATCLSPGTRRHPARPHACRHRRIQLAFLIRARAYNRALVVERSQPRLQLLARAVEVFVHKFRDRLVFVSMQSTFESRS